MTDERAIGILLMLRKGLNGIERTALDLAISNLEEKSLAEAATSN